MYRRILVPIDLSDVELAKPAIATALMMAKESNGSVRLINVLPVTPVMLAEYVPPDFEAQQRAVGRGSDRHRRQGNRTGAGQDVDRRAAGQCRPRNPR